MYYPVIVDRSAGFKLRPFFYSVLEVKPLFSSRRVCVTALYLERFFAYSNSDLFREPRSIFRRRACWVVKAVGAERRICTCTWIMNRGSRKARVCDRQLDTGFRSVARQCSGGCRR